MLQAVTQRYMCGGEEFSSTASVEGGPAAGRPAGRPQAGNMQSEQGWLAGRPAGMQAGNMQSEQGMLKWRGPKQLPGFPLSRQAGKQPCCDSCHL